MNPINVKTLLFISSADKIYSYSFLFHCAKYWADKGEKVLYVTHQPMENLPQSVGLPRNAQNLENFKLIRFMYLPNWEDLLKHCYSMHFQQNPVSVIIVQELEKYCFSERSGNHDHTSLVCASLLHAASVCAVKNSKPAYVFSAFSSKNYSIPRTVCKNFFHNVWNLGVKTEDGEIGQRLIILTNLSHVKEKSVKLFVFTENKEGEFLEFESAFETVIEQSK